MARSARPAVPTATTTTLSAAIFSYEWLALSGEQDMGTIGEYLARMHFRMMDRPTYVVRSDTNRIGGVS